ncbi:hypothetical protein DX130_08215 [Paenibacillus paeoniae]|uniref:Uncharacterized protein n=2 Tax=Paenibacillus paeoniae TaxID=2292705 RepID=A0A371PLA2_9BACL|nr:hypothetical protein DX130_08215 [Paenibacillus paeoniae]
MRTSGISMYLIITVILVLWLDGFIDGKPKESANRLLLFLLFAGNAIMCRVISYQMDDAVHEILLIITITLPFKLYTFYLFRKFAAFLSEKKLLELSWLGMVSLIGRVIYLIVMGISFLLGYGTHVLLEKLWGSSV